MRTKVHYLFVIVLSWLAPISSYAQVEVKEISTRPGVTIRFVYAKAENPVASAVLFRGGAGNIGIFSNGSMRVENFLSGGAQRFTQNGISVVIPDVPSDRYTLDDFRNTPEHAQDNAALIEFLRQQSKVPVWAIGTSNGSLSAAASSTYLKEKGPDGLVLTSTVTEAPVPAAHSVKLAPLGEVKVPVLLVHHKQDGCKVTPYGAMPGLIADLKSAKKVELISEDGGFATGNPCHTGYHQFLGIEGAVTKDIADWIKRYESQQNQ
ncbi:MAG TPA: alpha/beta hydrolase [Noviherbaspirillum sp.]|uniref:alpha/beta hydrolase n=1 Tax=Noviherbaspirillum sp. TaxID=1926288 RepID=UPI002B4A199F|nr:alpha/beta hydrolase [Noviherbaspirillum sp.]HJV86964.1 alpha/beta hydrolase [Noviherbaspirillum sp.]